jgi:hypothetical protein
MTAIKNPCNNFSGADARVDKETGEIITRIVVYG